MKVLVTGGCGFLGSHVCEYYAKKGATVVAFDNMTKYELARTGYATEATRNHNWNLLESLGVQMVLGDIRDQKHLMAVADGCDYIIHTAAQPAMTISWEDPELDFSTNVIGTFNVLEAARKFNIPVASCATVHVYGNTPINDSLTEGKTRYLRQPVAIDESYPTVQGTITPLHASKRAGDLYVQAYIDTFKMEAASFRLTGIYGTRQFGGEDHGWVANFSIRAAFGLPLNVYGTGKQVRDIIYASDVAMAFDAFFETRKPGIYNIGGGLDTMISLNECIDLIGEITGNKPDVQYGPQRHGDLLYFVCDTAKAKHELGWQPKVMPKDGVTRLIDWIQNNREFFKQ